MFCPECRKHWDVPQKAEEATGRKRAAKHLRCTECGSPLAPDRLIAEFPEPPDPRNCGLGIVDRRMTVAEVLRETAGPNPVKSFMALSAMADDSRGSRPARRERNVAVDMEEHIDWDTQQAPAMQPRPILPSKRRGVRLRASLDLVMLFMVAVLIAAVTVHSVLGLRSRTTIQARPSVGVERTPAFGMPVASAAMLRTVRPALAHRSLQSPAHRGKSPNAPI
jgi:hypothetical protein